MVCAAWARVPPTLDLGGCSSNRTRNRVAVPGGRSRAREGDGLRVQVASIWTCAPIISGAVLCHGKNSYLATSFSPACVGRVE